MKEFTLFVCVLLRPISENLNGYNRLGCALAMHRDLCYYACMFKRFGIYEVPQTLLCPRTCVPQVIVSQAYGQRIFFTKGVGER